MLKIQVCRHKGNYFSRNKINGKKESAVNTAKTKHKQLLVVDYIQNNQFI